MATGYSINDFHPGDEVDIELCRTRYTGFDLKSWEGSWGVVSEARGAVVLLSRYYYASGKRRGAFGCFRPDCLKPRSAATECEDWS